MSPVQVPQVPAPAPSCPDTSAEHLMVAMLSGTDLGKHGAKVAAGLIRFYQHTLPHARELAGKAYPWLVDLFKGSDDFDAHWRLERNGADAPLIVPFDPFRPLALHPTLTFRYTDPFTGKTVSGLQLLLAVALTANPDFDSAIKVAVQSGGPLPMHPKTIRLVTLPGARKSHSTGVYLLRFNTKGNVLIDTAVTTTFKERLDLPFYSTAQSVVNAASWVDQRRDRDDFILFDLACYADSIPQLDWITLGLKSLCTVMFATATGRGLNGGIVSAPPDADAVSRLRHLWDELHNAVAGGMQIFPYKPDATGPETFEELYTLHLARIDKHGSIGGCYALVRTMSLLADTGDYGAFRPLPAHAWASARPVPRGVYGDTTPKTPPTISAYRYTHRARSPRDRSPVAVRASLPAAVPAVTAKAPK